MKQQHLFLLPGPFQRVPSSPQVRLLLAAPSFSFQRHLVLFPLFCRTPRSHPPDEEKGPGTVCRALHRLLEPKPSRASLEGICFNPCSSTSAPLTPAGLGGIWDSALPARLSRLFLDIVVYHSPSEGEKQNPATSKHRQVKCSA